jgi:putative Flp pilus-assembly TadE/G-like protein
MTDPGRKGERGAVLVMVVCWLPVILLFGMLVFEVGNWFEHKRHLQMQADAGALAGGSMFNGCFENPAAANTAIEREARRFAGDPTAPAAGDVYTRRFNDQVGGVNQGTVTFRLNRKTFQVGGPPADNTVEDVPCTAKMVDVKMTEAGLPWFFQLAFVRAINARARVEIQQKESSSSSLPVGVPDNNPASGAVIFVNEATGGVLATQTLTKGTTATLNGVSLTQWSSAASAVNIASESTGVIVAFSGLVGFSPSATSTLSEICNQTLVECYDGADTGPWTGLDFIHGYNATGGNGAGAASSTNPVLRDVSLYNQSCSDTSGPYFLLHATCYVGVRAKIDFGTGTNNPEGAPGAGGVNAVVKVDNSNTGCPNSGGNPKGCIMRYQTSGPNAGYFVTNGMGATSCESPAPVHCYPLMAADGVAHPFQLNWGTDTPSAHNKTGSLTNVQRSYSAGPGSDPIQYINVSELGPQANSLTIGSHTLSVTIGAVSSVQANQSSPTAPAISLKVTGSGSLGHAIDCDPTKNLQAELATGCAPTYAINHGTACQSYTYYQTLPQTANWTCTITQTGGAVGQVSQGMLDRTQGGSSTCVNSIHWGDVNGDGKVTVPEDISPSDPRLIAVFVTPFGSFSGSGNAVLPITNFATFYVTGFSKNGGGQGDPCPGADPVPTKTGGWIVGHFIKYVETNGGSGGGTSCNFSGFGTCVAVLTD